MDKLQAVRGMNDILPGEIPAWQRVEALFREMTQAFGYQEIRSPLVEKTELFKRCVGEVTDIVEKEMYTFEDRNGESLSLRPEGTASCVRAGIEHGFLHHQIQRLWYLGPCFRHERPQKGRYRQFYQLALEAFGMPGAWIEAEIIAFARDFFQKLGVLPHLQLEINTLGNPESRARYRDELTTFLKAHRDQLDEDSLRRLDRNPLRILDSKNPEIQVLLVHAPKLEDFLDEDSLARFAALKSALAALNIPYVVNPHLVRGLDYYSHTVFEWVTTALGAQGTVCAGGRYDGLVELLGGKSTPAVGFGLGVERVIALLPEPVLAPTPDIYMISLGDEAQLAALKLAAILRQSARVVMDASLAGMKAQMKRADQSGATVALILGETELAEQRVQIKYLRAERPSEKVELSKITAWLEEKSWNI